jgi:hypothetical protein
MVVLLLVLLLLLFTYLLRWRRNAKQRKSNKNISIQINANQKTSNDTSIASQKLPNDVANTHFKFGAERLNNDESINNCFE